MSKPIVSIIIPVRNGGRTIDRCLKSVSELNNSNYECIVVDDSSTDNTLDKIKQFDVKVIELEMQQGAAQARNIGAEEASGDILLFIDSDVTIYPDCLDRIIKTFKANSDISALFGSYDEFPDCRNICSQYKNLFHRYIHQVSETDASTFWTACGAVYKEKFNEVGKFNKNVRMMEDIDLGYRLKSHGYKILLVKNLVVKHLKSYTFMSLVKSDFFDRAIPWTILLLKNKQFKSDLNLKLSHKVSAIIMMLLSLLFLFSFYSIKSLIAVPILMLIFFMLNYNFYQYFYQLKGSVFTLKIIPLHMLYYCYSLLGYMVGTLKYHLRQS